jgi:hypothetical protein
MHDGGNAKLSTAFAVSLRSAHPEIPSENIYSEGENEDLGFLHPVFSHSQRRKHASNPYRLQMLEHHRNLE